MDLPASLDFTVTLALDTGPFKLKGDAPERTLRRE